MSLGKELNEIDTWLYATLSAGTALTAYLGGTANPRIYSELAPQGAALPYIVYDNMSAVNENAVNGARCIDAVYQVKVVTEGLSYAPAGTIFAQADALIHAQRGTVSGTVLTLSCVQIQPVRYSEITAGKRFNHYGAMYRIFAGGTVG